MKWKKLMSGILSAALLVTSITPTAAAVEAVPVEAAEEVGGETAEVKPIAAYAFEDSLKDEFSEKQAYGQQSGNATFNAYTGDFTYAEGRTGNALKLGEYGVGLNQKNLGKNYTVSAWLKSEANLSENQAIFFLGYNDPEKWLGFAGADKTDGKTVKLWGHDGSAYRWKVLNGKVQLPANEWHNLVLAGSDGSVDAYMDGELMATYEAPNALDGENQDIFLGATFWDTEFAGLVDDVQIFNQTLTADQVKKYCYETAVIPEKPSEENLMLYYDFVLQNSFATEINDASGHNNAGHIKAAGEGQVEGNYVIADTDIFGKTVKALSLPGGDDGTYLQLPNNVFDGMDAATISMWVNLSTDTAYQRIWDFGKGSGSDPYMYLLSDGWNDGFTGYASAICSGGWQNEKGVQKETNIGRNRWVLTTVVMDGSKMSLYENGQLIGTNEDTGMTLKDLGETDSNYIGYGQYKEAPTKGQFAEVKIYNKALTAEEISAMYPYGAADMAAADKAALALDEDVYTEDFELPAVGVYGSELTWASDNAAIAIDGNKATVTRPESGKEDAKVTLTATIKNGEAVETKTFAVTVSAEMNNAQIVANDKEKLTLGDTSALVARISLPDTGAMGSKITWETSDASVIKANGRITRPAVGQPDGKATLTATITYGDASDTKTFDIVVLAKPETKVIESYEEIKVTTEAGVAPSLPNFVKVKYSNGAEEKVRVVWPAYIDKTQYASVGTFEVKGTVQNSDYEVQAVVTVVEENTTEADLLAGTFNLNNITLEGDSVLTQNRARTVAYLKLLDNDRMLYNFRKTFGQDTKGAQPLGGWDEPSGLLRGHSTGHYLSALSLAYASTGDAELKTKLDYMITEMRKLQVMSEGDAAAFKTQGTSQSVWSTDPKTWGKGFISAYSPDQFALLEVYTPYATIWAPYYTLHKLMAGYLDAYTYAGNEEALEIAKDLGKWVYNRLSACSQEQLTKMWDMYIAGEFGGMNECLAQLYRITKDPDYLAAAKLFDNTKFFDNLAANYDDIANRHANQHIPQIVGALELYQATVEKGEPETYYYDVAKNFWDMVISRYAYSIGGVGMGEKFQQPYKQATNINNASNCETCAAYNLLKLTRDLYQYDPDNAEYMDYYERTLYNQILASQCKEVYSNMHNGTTYMLPIGPGQMRDYGDDYGSFSCCHGTGMENHVKYQEAAYYHTDDTMYVNLYMPTTVTWADKGVVVKQEMAFPSETTKLTVSAIEGKTAEAFAMKLRVPYWVENGFEVKVNGTAADLGKVEPSSYVTVNVKAGDVIDVSMPYTCHLDTTPDKLDGATVASVMYGPWVMVAQNDDPNWKTLIMSTDLTQSVKAVEDAEVPTVEVNGMKLSPLYSLGAYDKYHTYFKVVQSDDDVDYFQASVTNLTESRGTFELSSQVITEGDKLTITAKPKEGYKVASLAANGKAITPVSENTYVIDEVYENIDLLGLFCKIEPAEADPTRLEQAADPVAHYTSSWENLAGIKNEAWEPSKSAFGTGKGWGDWEQPTGSWAWIAYVWDAPVTLNTNQIYWYDDGGGTQVPSEVYFDYMDEDGNWHDAVITSSDYFKKDQYNNLNVEDITCLCLRLNMKVRSSAVGIGRWKVSYVDETAADKSILRAAVEISKALKEANFTADTWKVFADALKNAEDILAKEDATQEEVDNALADFQAAVNGLKKVDKPTPTEIPEVLADFDFDDEETGLTSEYGTAAGNHELKDSYAASAGKALYLDGTNFLNVTNKDGGSLLTGVNELTVSFEMKSDRTGIANWPFYAAPNGDTQKYEQEHYIGLLETSGALKAERYNGGPRAQSNEATASSTDWFRVDLVYAETGTELYVNGEKQGETVASTFKLADILGDSSILQIGKANWESGEYFKGWIDNYKIVSKALTAEEIKANADAFLKAKPADKTALEKKIKAAISEDKKDQYTEETWKAYADALAAAKAVEAKADATQTEVDAALKTLTDAQKALKKVTKPTPVPADKKALQTAVDAAAALKEADYTAESWAALQTALKDAQAVLDKADAAQADVDAAVKAVDAAVKALVKATQPKPPKIDHSKHIGMTFYVGDLKYKITKDDGKVQEVRVTSLKNKKAAKVTIPKKVTCTKLSETFKVTSIKAKAFKGTNIKKVVIGANVTKIGPNAFLNCKKLTTVTIGKSVKSIGTRAFYGCAKLTKVTIKSKVVKTVKKNAFKRISKKAVIKVPKGKKIAYAKRFKGRIAKGVKIK